MALCRRAAARTEGIAKRRAVWAGLRTYVA
jgi:hypothetical protein